MQEPSRHSYSIERKLMSRIRISGIAAIAATAVAIHAASIRPAYTQAKPDLVVLIAVDQFSAGLFDQWRGRFNSGSNV